MPIGTLARKIAAALPWHLRQTITAARANWRGRKPSFEGVYPSFAEFTDTMIVAEEDSVRAALQGLLESRNASPKLGLLHHRRGRSVLSQTVALLGVNGRKVRILDYGGAAGADFSNLLISNKNANVEYHVVDFPAVCKAAKQHWLDDNRITFSPDLPSKDERFDLVYSWGSIQYSPDPIALVSSFSNYRPSAILIVGTAFADREFVRRQINQSASFPHWVINLHKIETAMRAVGYRLVCRQAIGEDHNVDNFGREHQAADYASLMFTPLPNLDL